VSVKALVVSAAVCSALVAGAVLVFQMSVGDALLLAPIIVVTVGATVGIVALWVKIAVDSLRRQRHPRRIVAGALAAIGLLVALSFFVQLPSGH
jgi:hypothetical protein